MALNILMALGIDTEMAPSKTEFQAGWQNNFLMSHSVLLWFVHITHINFYFAEKGSALWRGSLQTSCFIASVLPPLQNTPLIAAAKKADSSFCTLLSLLKTFVAIKNHCIPVMYCDFLSILITTVVCCCLLTLCLRLFVLHFLHCGHGNATCSSDSGWAKEKNLVTTLWKASVQQKQGKLSHIKAVCHGSSMSSCC